MGEIVTARKCLVDGTTGTIKLSEEGEDQCGPIMVDRLSRQSSMDSSSQQEENDYVNCTPVMFQPIVKPDSSVITIGSSAMSCATDGREDDLDGDYVLMNPASKIRRKSSNSQSSSSSSANPVLSVNTSSISFRPIPSSADQQIMAMESGVGSGMKSSSLFNRQFSLNTVEEARSDLNSNYELLRTTSGGGGSGSDLSSMVRGGSANNSKRNISSRPSSVNSDKITSRISNLSLNRPNSANSDRLSTISSSSSSTSTLCGGGSSSSSSTTTLCGLPDKSQSPMTTLRLNSSSDPSDQSQGGQLASRPPSVTSEKELHYASLDLPACTTPVTPSGQIAPLAKPEPDFGSSSASKRNRNSTDSSSSSSATTTPSPNVNASSSQPVYAFNYAQIDFDKCETVKQQQSQPTVQPQVQQPPQ